jgi:hypothetical protein
MANFRLFFSVQGTGGSPTGPDPENRAGAQDTGSQGRPVSSGLQVPDEPCRAKDLSASVYSAAVVPRLSLQTKSVSCYTGCVTHKSNFFYD